MTVKELKKALKNYPDDMLVILQQDPEGNGYSPLAGTDTAFYKNEKNEQEVLSEEDIKYLKETELDNDEDAYYIFSNTLVPALILFPIN